MMLVAKRISNGRIVTGQSGVSERIVRANVAGTPIPADDVEVVEMTAAAFAKAMKAQVAADFE